MRRFIFFSFILFALFSILAYLWFIQVGAADKVKQFQQRYPFSDQEMTFQSSGRTLSGDGLILYQPTFPKLPLKMKADKITLRTQPKEIKIHLSDITVDIAQTLTERGPQYLLSNFRQLSMPEGLIRYPLEVMTVLRRDIWTGTADLTIDQKGEETLLIAELLAKNGEKIELRMPVSDIPERGLWGWTRGSVQTIGLTVSGKAFPMALSGYYRAIGYPLSDSIKQSVEDGEGYHTLIHLQSPLKLSDIFLTQQKD